MLNGTERFQDKAHPVFALIAESDRLAQQSDELLKSMARFDDGVTQSIEMANCLLSAQHSEVVARFAQ